MVFKFIKNILGIFFLLLIHEGEEIKFNDTEHTIGTMKDKSGLVRQDIES